MQVMQHFVGQQVITVLQVKLANNAQQLVKPLLMGQLAQLVLLVASVLQVLLQLSVR